MIGSVSILAALFVIAATTQGSGASAGHSRRSSRRNFVEEGQKVWQTIVARRAPIAAAIAFFIVITIYVRDPAGSGIFRHRGVPGSSLRAWEHASDRIPTPWRGGKDFRHAGTARFIRLSHEPDVRGIFGDHAVSLLIFISLRYRVLPLVALATALSFAFAQNVWNTAIHADPHPLTALIAASLWLMALKWRDSGDRRWLWTMAFVSGLGLGGAVILVAELPAIIIFAVITRPRDFFAPITMIVAGLLGAIGVVGIYTYLPIRAMMNAPLNYWDPQTWERFRVSYERWRWLIHSGRFEVNSGGSRLERRANCWLVRGMANASRRNNRGGAGGDRFPYLGATRLAHSIRNVDRILPSYICSGFGAECRARALLHDVELAAVFPGRGWNANNVDRSCEEDRSRIPSTIATGSGGGGVLSLPVLSGKQPVDFLMAR